ncbi:MAG: aldo/keto reductase [Anaerolineae bacterium]
MQYVELGNTGYRASRLGFGSMRLPMVRFGDKEYVDAERAIEVLHQAFARGVNYVDTGLMYCNEESEFAVGSALATWPQRHDIIVTAKCTKFRMQQPGDLRRNLEHQLWKQRRESFDFYLFHGIGWENWHEIDARTDWIADMARAREEGLVKHIGFSFHDTPENLIRLVDVGLFELVTCQYNYLDRSNEEAIAYAKSKGLAVVVMGPVGGGRLAVVPKALRETSDLSQAGASELALRFVLSNPSVDIALSGMGSVEMVEQNCAAVDQGPLTVDQVGTINTMMEQTKELARLYCTGCEYCLPCPQNVSIPRAFELYNYHQVYGLEAYALQEYAALEARQTDASRCIACGTCLDRCPQHIDIPAQMKQVLALLGHDRG